MRLLFTTLFLVGIYFSSNAQEWTTDQMELIEAVSRLSASTAKDGGGADAYGAMLASDFSRWTVGSNKLNYKDEWVQGVKEWFEDGWYVSKRSAEYVEISVKGNFGFIRRNVEETFKGPKGEHAKATASVAEYWEKREGDWLLVRSNVHAISE